MKAETGTNIASPLLRSTWMACWGNLERTSWSWRKINQQLRNCCYLAEVSGDGGHLWRCSQSDALSPSFPRPRCFWPSFPWLLPAEFSATSVTVPSGSSSKLTSGPFFNTDAHRRITWRGSYTTRCVRSNQATNQTNKQTKRTTAGGSHLSATKASRTINAKGLKHVSRKVTGHNVCDVLFITGGSVHHGNEENLPKTESECSMCQGQRSV